MRLFWNVYGNEKGPIIAYAMLKKSKVERHTLSDFKNYYKAKVIKVLW